MLDNICSWIKARTHGATFLETFAETFLHRVSTSESSCAGCAQQFWVVSEVELDPTSETVARNVSRNIGMGGHTLKHCVAHDVSANVQEMLHRVSGPLVLWFLGIN